MRKALKAFKNQSIFYYILMFSAMVVLIIGLLGGYLYRFYYRTLYNDFLSSNEAWLSSVAGRHEYDMQTFSNVALEMGISMDIAAFKLDEQPEKSIRLKERLNQYMAVSQNISDIFYAYHQDNYIYDYRTSADIDRFFTSGIVLEETEPWKFRELVYQDIREMTALPEQSISGYLTGSFKDVNTDAVIYIYPVAPKYWGNVVFVVNSNYYEELLSASEEQKRETCLLYDGQIITRRGNLGLSGEALTEALAGAEDGQKKISIDGKSYLLTAASGSGLTYCSIQPMGIFYDKIMTQQWGIILLLLICSIPASFIIVSLSRNLMGKVKGINILLNDEEESYYNISNIESGIRMLVENSRETEKESASLRRTKFLINFIRSEYPDRKSMEEMAHKAELCVDYRYFAVLLMGDRGNSNERKAHEKMLAEVARAKGIEGYGMNLISNNQSLFVIFGDEPERLCRIEKSIFNIGKKYCEEFIMAVSGLHEKFAEASEAYLEADAAFDNRFLMDNDEIIRYESLADTKEVHLLPENYLKRLKNAIRTGQEKEMETTVEEICRRLKKENYTLLTFRLLYNDIIHMLVSEWNIGEGNFKNIYNVFTLSQCLTIQDFSDVLCEVCRSLMHIRQKKEKDAPGLAEAAIVYMKENFQSVDLNMGALADKLEVSPVTLAVEFKSEMGMSPSDYLALLRMEKARELLRSTDMRVKEVSLAVGYEDDHVFMRRFKKYVGMTPGQYRSEA